MSINFQDIKLALYNWCYKYSNETTVIWLNPNAPRPPLPYITLHLTNLKAIGWDFETPPDDDGLASLFGSREFYLEVNYYGDGLDTMERLRTSLQRPDAREELLEKGVFYVDRISQFNLTELLDTKFEERYMMELKFRISNQGVTTPDKFDVGLIESTEISGKYKKEDNQLHKEQDFDVNGE